MPESPKRTAQSRWRRLLGRPLVQLLILILLALPLFMQLTATRHRIDPLDYLLSGFTQQVAEPESYMTGLHLKRFGDDGHIRYAFTASRAVRQSDTHITILTEPRMRFFRSVQPWSIDSSFAKVSADGETIELWDGVALRRLDASLDIRTGLLMLYPQRDYAETDRAVTMIGPGHRTQATGLKAYLDQERLVLLSDVRSTHEATSP